MDTGLVECFLDCCKFAWVLGNIGDEGRVHRAIREIYYKHQNRCKFKDSQIRAKNRNTASPPEISLLTVFDYSHFGFMQR